MNENILKRDGAVNVVELDQVNAFRHVFIVTAVKIISRA